MSAARAEASVRRSLSKATECFVTSATREVMPVVERAARERRVARISGRAAARSRGKSLKLTKTSSVAMSRRTQVFDCSSHVYLFDHVPHGHAAGDHRQHVLLVGDFDVEHVRAGVVDHFFERGHEVGLVADVGGAAAVAFGDRDEVGVALAGAEAVALAAGFGVVDRAEVRVGPVALHEAVFPLHDHAEVLVVEQQHFHGQVFAEAGGQLLDVHLEAAVAVDIDHEAIGELALHAHRRRAGRSPSCPGRCWRGTCAGWSNL